MKNMLQDYGYFVVDFFSLLANEEIAQVKNEVAKQKWVQLDQRVQGWNEKEGVLFKYLSQFSSFSAMEHIIAIRQAPDDEDGIWHDDGSRVLAFSLSLNLLPKNIKGGELLFKHKDSPLTHIIAPLEFGEMIVFLTGTSCYEHKVNAVTEETRIVVAGWCQ